MLCYGSLDLVDCYSLCPVHITTVHITTRYLTGLQRDNGLDFVLRQLLFYLLYVHI
jgi:hypothetical protein